MQKVRVLGSLRRLRVQVCLGLCQVFVRVTRELLVTPRGGLSAAKGLSARRLT